MLWRECIEDDEGETGDALVGTPAINGCRDCCGNAEEDDGEGAASRWGDDVGEAGDERGRGMESLKSDV